MRIGVRALWLSAAVMVAGVACAPKSATPAEMLAAADSLDKAFQAAFNAGDVDAIMATYWNSPELVSIGLDGEPVAGWDAVRSGMATLFQSMPGARLALHSATSRVEGGVVLTSGRFRLTVPVAGGPEQVMEGRFSDVKAPRDGKWVYVMDHASVSILPPPPAAKP